MKRILISLILLLALLLCATTASAASVKLPDYALVVSGKQVALTQDTGYLYRDGSAMMVPVQALCDALSIPYTADTWNENILIQPDGGSEIRLRVGEKSMQVDGKKVALRVKSVRKASGAVIADSQLLKAMGYVARHYPKGAALKKLGYKSGALAVAAEKSGLGLPSYADPDEMLPKALRGAAKVSDQIVAIQYSGTKNAAMALYEKRNGEWEKTIEETAYVGSAGVGKTKEGDKKTPTGTFNLTTPFGIKKDPGTKMGGYLKVTKNHYWSGQNGENYNRLVDVSKAKDYKPSGKDEHLIDYGAVYNYCLFIDYNKDGAKNKGSAIFLHCQGKNNYTGGCVAVPERVMIKLLETLSDGAKIVIYQ